MLSRRRIDREKFAWYNYSTRLGDSIQQLSAEDACLGNQPVGIAIDSSLPYTTVWGNVRVEGEVVLDVSYNGRWLGTPHVQYDETDIVRTIVVLDWIEFQWTICGKCKTTETSLTGAQIKPQVSSKTWTHVALGGRRPRPDWTASRRAW